MTGGMICPFTDEATSTAPAASGLKPTRFIKGMVKVPVVTVFAMEDPEIKPVMAEETTAAFAGPPRRCPIRAKAILMNQFPAPALSSREPNKTKRKTRDVETFSAIPKTPSSDNQKCHMALS